MILMLDRLSATSYNMVAESDVLRIRIQPVQYCSILAVNSAHTNGSVCVKHNVCVAMFSIFMDFENITTQRIKDLPNEMKTVNVLTNKIFSISFIQFLLYV